jgi:hypothetical protein
MADEITMTVALALTNGALKEGLAPGAQKLDQAVALSHAPTLIIGTSEEAIPAGDVATLGWVIIQNLDGANYVDYGPDSGGSMVGFGRLEAGETQAFRLKPGITWKAQADTAPVKVKMVLLND